MVAILLFASVANCLNAKKPLVDISPKGNGSPTVVDKPATTQTAHVVTSGPAEVTQGGPSGPNQQQGFFNFNWAPYAVGGSGISLGLLLTYLAKVRRIELEETKLTLDTVREISTKSMERSTK